MLPMEIGYSVDRTRVPNASLKILQRLGKTLIRDKPEVLTPSIAMSLNRLIAQVEEVDAALIDRFRAVNPQLIASEMEFDRSTDMAWVWLRRLLEGWRDLGSHPGLAALAPELQGQANLAGLRKRAETARSLHERLFGAEGTAWVMSSFIEQSQTMATILGVIKADGLRGDLDAVIGPELPLLLETLQIQYETMVSTRMSREAGPAENLRTLRAKLRWWIDHYKNAVESLRDPDDPKSFEMVDRALRSLILLSQRTTSGATSQEIDELLDEELVELEVPANSPESPEAAALLDAVAG
jgi:hypothetical protein